MTTNVKVLDDLTEEECYLYVLLLTDESGIDQAEFTWFDPKSEDGCWRAWPFQWPWWRDKSPKQIDRAARSVGKSLSIQARACAFPLVFPGHEMIITAPEGNHLDRSTSLIEKSLLSNRILRELIWVDKRSAGIKHKPFEARFKNGSYIMGRIPKFDGSGVKGVHPLRLEMDESFPAGTLILTKGGHVPIEQIEIGAEVWTHKNRWKKVTKVFDRGFEDMVKIMGQGHHGLECSTNHKFWVTKEEIKLVPSVDCNGRISKKKLVVHSEPEMVPAVKLDSGHYWATPTRLDGNSTYIPNMVDPGTSPDENKWEHQIDVHSTEWAWLCGLWVAEGSAGATQSTWSVHTDEVEEICRHMKKIGVPFGVYPQRFSKCSNITVYSLPLAHYMKRHFGKGAHNKHIPIWALRSKRLDWRQALFDGAIYGDGNTFQNGWNYTTVSKELAIGMSMLATSLDYEGVGIHFCDTSHLEPSVIRGREIKRGKWYQVRISRTSNETFTYDKKRWRRIRSVTPLVNQQRCYDLEVEDDHSFVVESNVCSNSQDYPKPGWEELIETVLQGEESSQWRSHGVTKGIVDDFYKATQPGSGWKVHEITAMSRPTWSDEERQSKIQQYRGYESTGYKRNVWGFHGDASNVLFILHMLMKCFDIDPASSYNEEYIHIEIDDSDIKFVENIVNLINLPTNIHKSIWMGADIGFLEDPTEIVIFAEVPKKDYKSSWLDKKKPEDEEMLLKLITRITLRRISAPKQADVVAHLIQHYNPIAFSMDATGSGLPLWQSIREDENNKHVVNKIKGYNFKENIIVDIKDLPGVEWADLTEQEKKDNGIKRRVVEYASDQLREYVDTRRLLLPDDDEVLRNFQMPTFVYSKTGMDRYGHKVFSKSDFHILDACRMMVVAHTQYAIEKVLGNKRNQKPVFDAFIEF